jgi:hypothetical protein
VLPQEKRARPPEFARIAMTGGTGVGENLSRRTAGIDISLGVARARKRQDWGHHQ